MEDCKDEYPEVNDFCEEFGYLDVDSREVNHPRENEECPHENIIDGNCSHCGLIIEFDNRVSYLDSYGATHSRSVKVGALGFEKDLANLDIPDRIKEWVIKKAISAPKVIFRMGHRKEILAAYIILAHIDMNIGLQPEKIAIKLKLTKSQMRRIVSLVSGTSRENLPQAEGDRLVPVIVQSPIPYLDDILKNVNMVKYKKKIEELTICALDLNQSLREQNPFWVAVCVVKFFIEEKEKRRSKSKITGKGDFYQKVGVGSASIRNCLIEVKKTLSGNI